ncbi:MAG: bifunctional diaminohydroxyphosphoribosylaminopyrimidine deaminase/5-amino-6-(5-phosphoribosylamino)uracil reductase RibD [Actinomycetota bacterium]|nr:bifunctional diaminohydroxyphosphoribosylaminopyrimidine deaminase/5-amino-6-(5-phosphoribosylamino)uracil reductase RibD [Actinomycetota bacterium]
MDDETDTTDEAMMRRALALAAQGRGLVSPNPMVGAVLVRDGRVVGEGWHDGPGNPHAEIHALRAAGDLARSATLYVTLEPCDHHGRTPPCTNAILDAGITRVVAAGRDPNPAVDGRGFERLRAAGVEVNAGVLETEAERLNEAFAKHVRTGLPFVVLKMAATLDGKVAARDGSSRWITGERARAEVHRMRGAADAILVGAGTALADDPSVTVRDPEYRGRPVLRVLADAGGRVPPTAKLFSEEAPTLVATTEAAPEVRRRAWADTGAEVVVFDPAGAGVPLDALFAHLGKRDIQLVLMEGGPTLAWSAVRDGLVDRLVLFLAPKLVGGTGAPGILGGEGLAPIARALDVEIEDVALVGPDIKVEARVHRDR